MSVNDRLRFARPAVAFLLLGLCATGCSEPPRDSGSAGARDGSPRRVAFLNTDTGERLSVVYRKGGEYDPEAMAAISAMFRDRRTDEVKPIDPILIDYMSDLVAASGKPDTTEIELTSGYRSPTTNAALARVNSAVADESYHMRGQAADFRIPGVPLRQLAAEAAEMRRGGYAIYATHMHVDSGPFRTWGGGRDREGEALVARASSKHTIRLAAASRSTVKPGPTKVAVRSLVGGEKASVSGKPMLADAVPAPAKPAMVMRASFKLPAAKPGAPAGKKVVVKPRDRRA